MRILHEELERALRNPRIWLALSFPLVFFAHGVLVAYQKEWVPGGFSYADLWYFVYSGSYFPYLLPLAAVLPFADSLVVDRSEGFLRYLVMRSRYHYYLSAKFIANAVVAGLVIFLPLMGLYLFSNLVAPRAVYPINVWQPGISGRPYGILMPLFQTHPDGFILLVTLLAALVGALYSSLGLAISLVVPNRYLAWGIPCALYLLSDFIALRTHLFGPAWSPVVATAGSLTIINETVQAFFLNPLGVLGLVLLLVALFGQRGRILT